MKILVIHPGHAVSTNDVFEGVCAGLRGNGAEVVTFDWQRVVQTFTGLVVGAAAGGALPRDKMEAAHKFCSHIAAADATNIALAEDVDAAIVVNGLLFPPSRVAPLRLLGIPVGCIGTESPYFDDAELQIAPFYTHWYTNERTAVKRFQDVAVMGRAFYLPMAWNPEKHQPVAVDPERSPDVVFIGGGFPERKRLLFGEEQPQGWMDRLLRRRPRHTGGVNWTDIDHRILGTLWNLDIIKEQGMQDFLRGSRYAAGAIPNEETAIWHRSAKIALNLHRRMTYVEKNTPLQDGAAESLGPRAYEIPAVQGFQLIDDERPEVFDVFGESAATFKAWNADSLSQQLRYWLRHPDERERQQRAQYEAVQPHSWTHRAKSLLETLMTV